MKTIEDVVAFINSNEDIMPLLKMVRSLDLPDCWIGAGTIRNTIWSYLHGKKDRAGSLADIDIIYFDSKDVSAKRDEIIEAHLNSINKTVVWEVRNQARMHIRNSDKPYENCFDAIKYWPETATAIAARLNEGTVELIAPYGIDDLVQLIVRPTPEFASKKAIYASRLQEKQWEKYWPNLVFVE